MNLCELTSVVGLLEVSSTRQISHAVRNDFLFHFPLKIAVTWLVPGFLFQETSRLLLSNPKFSLWELPWDLFINWFWNGEVFSWWQEILHPLSWRWKDRIRAENQLKDGQGLTRFSYCSSACLTGNRISFILLIQINLGIEGVVVSCLYESVLSSSNGKVLFWDLNLCQEMLGFHYLINRGKEGNPSQDMHE